MSWCQCRSRSWSRAAATPERCTGPGPGGLDEPRRRHTDQEGATDEEQRLSAGEVLDVADQLAHVGLAQVASDGLCLIGGARREVGHLRLLRLHVRRDTADAIRDGLDAVDGLVEPSISLLEADLGAALNEVRRALACLCASLRQRVGRLARGGADVLAGTRGVERG